MADGSVARITAVVLAGGPHDGVAATTPGAPNKAFAAINGVTLVERTLRALHGARAVGRIVVVAPERMRGTAALALADAHRPDGPRITESLRSGLQGLPASEHVLVSTSDLPVLTAQAVDDYVGRALALEAEITYGCIERRVHESKYPGVPHTWARLADGTYCGTGLVSLRPRVFPSLERFIERLGRARKNPVALARLFGLRILLRYATGRLSIVNAEVRASRVIGAAVRAIVSPFPEIGVNVDRVSDIAIAERLTAPVSEASPSA